MSVRVMRWGRVWAGGGFDLAGVFAELGRDVVEVEGVVDVLFGGGGDDGVVFERGARAYSLRVRPRLMARWRRATLCILEPVKYCRAAP